MQKLQLIQIMDLADKLDHTEWVGILLKLNDTNQLENFFKLIQNQQMLQSVLQDKKKSHTR